MKIKLIDLLKIYLYITITLTISNFHARINLKETSALNNLSLENLSKTKDENNLKNLPKNKNLNKYIEFSFDNENLTEIINYVASKFKINILLPQEANAIKQKITFNKNNKNKITLKQAWQLLNMFLEFSGYALTLQGKFYLIAKKELGKTARHPYPLFIGVNPDELPNTDQRIQYVYFLSNIKVPNKPTKDNPLTQILEETLSENSIIYDSRSNAVILNGTASKISSVMRIIVEFDKSGFKETLEVIPLYYASALTVSTVLEELVKAAKSEEEKSPFIGKASQTETSVAFPSGTKIKYYGPKNSLIIMGRESAVNRIKEFISKHIDIPQRTGQSILHVYDLQYLEAETFGPLLSKVLARQITGAQSETTKGESGPERYFQGPPIVVAEGTIKPEKKEGEQYAFKQFQGMEFESKEGKEAFSTPIPFEETGLIGGNRIIVAALQKDWQAIKKLIQQLDRPEPQVILEILTIDVTVAKNKIIGTSTRRRRGECFCPSKDRLEFLASNLTNSTANLLCDSVTSSGTSTTGTTSKCGTSVNDLTLAADLLQIAGTNSVPSEIFKTNPGSILISFKDAVSNKVWSILEVLDQVTETKVLNHPFLVTLNNKPAQTAINDIRRGQGTAVGTESGVVTIPFIDISAPNIIQAIPRIASLNELNLQLKVNLTTFINDNINVFTRNTRLIQTNVNMNSSQVLAMGGIGRLTSDDVYNATPILASIPFIGQFFRYNQNINTNLNILILVAPTIVHPKRRAGANLYTTDEIRSAREKFDNSIFLNEREPIIRWFFGEGSRSDEYLKDYLYESKNAPEFVELLSKKELIKSGLVKPKKEKLQTVIEDPLEKEKKLKQVLAYEENPLLGIEQTQRQKIFNG